MLLKKFYTLSEAQFFLQEMGYTDRFNLYNGYLHCIDKALNFRPHELEITEVYSGNQDDNAILYAIESAEHGLKGLLVNSF